MSGVEQILLWALVLVPAVVGAGLVLIPRLERAAAAVSISTAALTSVIALAVAVLRPSVSVPFVLGSDFGLEVDPLSALLVPTVALISTLALMVAAAEITDAQARFHGLMLLFASFALVTASATNLPTLLFAWELMGATSYALIGFWWADHSRVGAGLTAFVTTRSADLGLYLAAGAALAGGAGLGLAELTDAPLGWRNVIVAGIVVAALGKAAQLPFSFWLSGAMAGPSPVSALLHSAAMVAMGGYLLLRVEPLLAVTPWAANATAWVGGLTALVLGVVALAQRDLKQLLAASTAAQLGFVVLAAGVGSVAGGASHLVGHAFTKALLFLVAGIWLTALGTKSLLGLRGIARRWPVVGLSAVVGLASLAGLAPLSLWVTKDTILSATREDSWALYAVALVASALSAGYAGKVLFVVWPRVADSARPAVRADYDTEQPGTRTVHRIATGPVVVLAVGAALFGVLMLAPVGQEVAQAIEGPDAVQPGAIELLASGALAVGVLLAVWRWRVPEPAWARDWLGLENGARVLVVDPTLRLAQALARFDDAVLDRAVDGIGRVTMTVAAQAGRFDDVAVDGAVRGAARSVRRLATLARHPQTGLVHQYYLQSTLVIAAGFLLLMTVR
ncbi:MAG: proton-conducting transporter membrane subunit [Ornithinimicrobium sp.]